MIHLSDTSHSHSFSHKCCKLWTSPTKYTTNLMSIFQVMCDKDLIRFLQNRTSCSRFPESQCTIFSPLWRQQQRCSPVRLRILWSADLCLFDMKKEIYRENKWNDAWLNNRTNLPLSSTDIGFSTTTVWLWEWGIDWRNTTNTNSTISITIPPTCSHLRIYYVRTYCWSRGHHPWIDCDIGSVNWNWNPHIAHLQKYTKKAPKIHTKTHT